MKSSKAQITAKFHKIPMIRFEDQQLTSFSGLLIFQLLFKRINLKNRLKKCFGHLKVSPIFGRHLIVMLIIIHLLIGFRRLREVDYYRDDPIVLRLMGLRKLPDVSTISRALSQMETDGVGNVRQLSRAMVIEGLQRERLPRLTLDFDGSVLSTKGHAEGSAVGFNKAKKGARSYYPLFCTVAQTGQFFDVHHRPGNVHDSNGADQFMLSCLSEAKTQFDAVLESRMDSAFFSQNILSIFNSNHVKFTVSVPFERLTQLKEMVESRKRWRKIDRQWSYFETSWKPKSWDSCYRFIFTRKKTRKPRKGMLQLHLFEPRDFDFDYKVIVTNKAESAKSVVLFHNGRGSQEAIFGDAKNDAALDVVPSKRLAGNQLFTLCAMMAHNLSREVQMLAASGAASRALPKRSAAWTFEKLDTLRHRIIQRAGRIIRPQGKLTLTMSANPAVRKDLLHFFDVLQKAA